MSAMTNVVIVMARCQHSRQTFGIRFEERSPGQWVGDWAFPIKESAARNEGYHQGDVRGAFSLDNAYPGCPHCRDASIFKCVCGKVSCWDGRGNRVVCPSCGATVEVEGQIGDLRAGKDR